MKKYRFTIRFLLSLTASVCVALAILRYPTEVTCIATFSATVTALVGSIIGSVTSRGILRAFCIGFAIAGSVHLILAFTTWFETGASQTLLSRYCLDQLAPVLGYQLQRNMVVEEASLANALANFVPGSPPALYYKYIVTGQSLITLGLAACGGAFGVYLRTRPVSDQHAVGTP
jgi:hypothetical protein